MILDKCPWCHVKREHLPYGDLEAHMEWGRHGSGAGTCQKSALEIRQVQLLERIAVAIETQAGIIPKDPYG